MSGTLLSLYYVCLYLCCKLNVRGLLIKLALHTNRLCIK